MQVAYVPYLPALGKCKKSKHCILFSQISSVYNEVFAVCLVDGFAGYLTLSIKDNISPPATDLQFPFH